MYTSSWPIWLLYCIPALTACSVPVSAPETAALPAWHAPVAAEFGALTNAGTTPTADADTADADAADADAADTDQERVRYRENPRDQDRVRYRENPRDQERVRYYDDRQQYRDDRRRRYGDRRTSFFGVISGAFGDYDVDDRALGRDDSNAYMQRFQFGAASDRGIGGGLDVKLFFPYDDYYEGTINETDLNQVDLYAYFMVHPPTRGRLRMPFRIGPYFSHHAAEFEVSGDDTIYASLGIRLEIEPEIVLIDDDASEMSIYGRFSAGAHTTHIDDDSTDEEYDSDGHSLGLEAGLRFVVGPVAVSGAYLYHENTIDESDVERGLMIPRLETEFKGVQFSLGVRF